MSKSITPEQKLEIVRDITNVAYGIINNAGPEEWVTPLEATLEAISEYDRRILKGRDSEDDSEALKSVRMKLSSELLNKDLEEINAIIKSNLAAHMKEERDRINSSGDGGQSKKANKAIMDLANNSRIIKDSKTGDTFFWRSDRGRVDKITPEVFKEHIGLGAYKDFYKRNGILAVVEYDPYVQKSRWKDKEDIVHINSYIPPPWLRPRFFDGEQIEACDIPPIMKGFLERITDGKDDSVQYLLDFMQNLLIDKCSTYLTLFGDKRIGKGVFVDICCELVGDGNYWTSGANSFESQFNDHLRSISLLALDEVSFPNSEANDRLKGLVNKRLRYEGKGKDATLGAFHANIILQCNPEESNLSKLDFKDPRLSIVNLTKKKLVDQIPSEFKDIGSYVAELKKEENIAQLGRYLLAKHKAENDLSRPFVDKEQHRYILDKALPGWFDDVLAWVRANPGRTASIKELQKELRDFYNTAKPPGRNKLDTLSEYGNYRISNLNDIGWHIIVDQPEVKEIDIEDFENDILISPPINQVMEDTSDNEWALEAPGSSLAKGREEDIVPQATGDFEFTGHFIEPEKTQSSNQPNQTNQFISNQNPKEKEAFPMTEEGGVIVAEVDDEYFGFETPFGMSMEDYRDGKRNIKSEEDYLRMIENKREVV